MTEVDDDIGSPLGERGQVGAQRHGAPFNLNFAAGGEGVKRADQIEVGRGLDRGHDLAAHVARAAHRHSCGHSAPPSTA